MTTHHPAPRVASSVALASRPTRNRRTLRFLVGLTAGIALMVASQTPASAHQIHAWYENNTAYTWTDHAGVTVIDGQCDGHRVRAQLRVNTTGGVVADNVYDPNGCRDGAGSKSWYPQRITHIRVCEVGVGCSVWRRVT
jgi:hypothetical protein